MRFCVGNTVKVCKINLNDEFVYLYDAEVVEANDEECRVVVKQGTHGFWYSQDGSKVGVDNGNFITKSLKYRSIDE